MWETALRSWGGGWMGTLGAELRGCASQRTPTPWAGVAGRGGGGGLLPRAGCCFVFRWVLRENQGFSGVFSSCFVLLKMLPGSCEELGLSVPLEKIFPGRADQDKSESVAGTHRRTHARTHMLPPGLDTQTSMGCCPCSPPHPAHRRHTQPRSRIHTHTTQVPNQAGRSSKAGSLKFKLLLLWYINMER